MRRRHDVALHAGAESMRQTTHCRGQVASTEVTVRRLTSILAGMLIAVSVFGAGEGEGAAGEIVEVTHMVADRGIVPAEVGTLQDNWFVDKMNETLAPSGVKVGIVVFPR